MPSKSKMHKSSAKPAPAAATPTKFQDRDLCSTNPMQQQFEPTPAMPVPQRYKMAGGA